MPAVPSSAHLELLQEASRLGSAHAATALGSLLGESITLNKLGHNASDKRGWHPYVVPVPVASTYTLEYTGKCSRALLCVRTFDAAPPPGDP